MNNKSKSVSKAMKTFQRMLILHEPEFIDKFDLGIDGNYSDPVVCSAYAGFLLGKKYGKLYGRSSENVCIIGNVDKNGIPHFSKNPYMHINQIAAETEAKRLIDLWPETKFSIYQFVKTVRINKKEEVCLSE